MTAGQSSMPFRPGRLIRQDLFVCLVLVLSSVLIGLALNALSVAPLPLGSFTPDQRLVLGLPGVSPGNFAEPRIWTLDEVQEGLDAETSLVVDAREREFYELGHLPGAVSLPRSQFRQGYAEVLGGTAKPQSVVVYCAESDCVDSTVVAKALQRLGHTDVGVFRGGWAEWEAAGLPQAP